MYSSLLSFHSFLPLSLLRGRRHSFRSHYTVFHLLRLPAADNLINVNVLHSKREFAIFLHLITVHTHSQINRFSHMSSRQKEFNSQFSQMTLTFMCLMSSGIFLKSHRSVWWHDFSQDDIVHAKKIWKEFNLTVFLNSLRRGARENENDTPLLAAGAGGKWWKNKMSFCDYNCDARWRQSHCFEKTILSSSIRIFWA